MVRVRNVLNGHETAAWKMDGFVTAVALSEDGRLAAMSADREPAVQVRNVTTGKLLALLPGHREGARKIVMSVDGTTVFTAAGSRLRVWRVSR
jgi:WD40 repeat protein